MLGFGVLLQLHGLLEGSFSVNLRMPTCLFNTVSKYFWQTTNFAITGIYKPSSTLRTRKAFYLVQRIHLTDIPMGQWHIVGGFKLEKVI